MQVAWGDAGLLEAALWLQPAGAAPADAAELSLALPGARWSGWRRAEPAGGELRITLEVPVGAPEAVAVALVLRNGGTRAGDVVRVEWAGLSGLRLGPPVPAVAAPPPLPLDAAPPLAAVRLQEHYATPDGGYRHLDIALERLRAGRFVWPRVRLKFALHGAEPKLEFRARPDWPTMFETWPGTQADAHGPFLLVAAADLAGGTAARLPGPSAGSRDRALLLTLARLLPAMVATAAREATADPAEYERWLAAARRFTAALPADAG